MPSVPGSQHPPRFPPEMVERCQMDSYGPVGLEQNPAIRVLLIDWRCLKNLELIRMNRSPFRFHHSWKRLDRDCSPHRSPRIPVPDSVDRMPPHRSSAADPLRTNPMIQIRFLEKILTVRSEERRVGKECRSRWSP